MCLLTRTTALPRGHEKLTSSTTRRCGMRIPTAKCGEVHVVIVVNNKHVLFSRQREVLSCTTCALSLDEILASLHTLLSLYPFRNFFSNNQGIMIIKYKVELLKYKIITFKSLIYL